MNRTTKDIQNLSQTIGFTIGMALVAPFMLIGSIILSIRINAQLSLVLLTTVPILSIYILIMMHYISKDFTTLLQSTDTLTQMIRELLTGIRVIRAFNKNEYELECFDNVNQRYVIKIGETHAQYHSNQKFK
ncbi:MULTISPECIES: ABC transporter transmembrane domain-containing protein [unclassified Granulicatella]|uniref:ABC transporter transmembrane domain-containing protein n=1 Tax=unclassified Granulicatella TaxID=2630493 RepID=UPI001073A4C2|nr:ABC transporter transmembrane domain-containing protein [Granulicatella sp. WM01]MBF0779968.1 hypothetical protein [Granulicatella sp. 19428wC4_WM01]TFU95984.1 ABC transporter ATP-binding protein [Granulicatella sp. WM01]